SPPFVCGTVAVSIAQTQDLVARGEIDRAVRMHRNIHRRLCALEESRETIRFAVAVRVFDNPNAVVLRTLIVRRTKMRVALDDQQPAAPIEGDTDRVNDARLLRE